MPVCNLLHRSTASVVHRLGNQRIADFLLNAYTDSLFVGVVICFSYQQLARYRNAMPLQQLICRILVNGER